MSKRLYDRTDAFSRLIQKHFGVNCIKEYIYQHKMNLRFDYALPTYKVGLFIVRDFACENPNPHQILHNIEKHNQAVINGWSILQCVQADKFSIIDKLDKLIKNQTKTI